MVLFDGMVGVLLLAGLIVTSTMSLLARFFVLVHDVSFVLLLCTRAYFNSCVLFSGQGRLLIFCCSPHKKSTRENDIRSRRLSGSNAAWSRDFDGIVVSPLFPGFTVGRRGVGSAEQQSLTLSKCLWKLGSCRIAGDGPL